MPRNVGHKGVWIQGSLLFKHNQIFLFETLVHAPRYNFKLIQMMAMIVLMINKLLPRSPLLTYSKEEVNYIIPQISKVLGPSKPIDHLFLSQTLTPWSVHSEQIWHSCTNPMIPYHLMSEYLETQKRVIKCCGPLQDCQRRSPFPRHYSWNANL